MMMRNPKKIWKKGLGKGHVVHPNKKGWDRLEYVEDVEQDQGGLPNWWNRGIFILGGLGTGWNSGQGFVQLYQSTYSNVGLQGCTIFIHTILFCVYAPALNGAHPLAAAGVFLRYGLACKRVLAKLEVRYFLIR